MKAILKILLLFTASRSALALCLANCDRSLPCNEVYSCLIDRCPGLTEKDLPDHCKCYVKCRPEFKNFRIRKDNCLFLQKLKTCFEDGGCSVKNVTEIQKLENECRDCEPKQCQDGTCLERLVCMTNSKRGGCATPAAVQAVMNTTTQTMYNDWFLPEECRCVSKCAFVTLHYIPSCMGDETTLQCAFKYSCPVKREKMHLAHCECEHACKKEIDEAMQATDQVLRCKAKSDYHACAKKFGCEQVPVKIQNIICESGPGNDSSFFGSNILLTILIVFTILFTFTTTNAMMT